MAEIWVEATTSVGNIGSSEPQRVVFADVKIQSYADGVTFENLPEEMAIKAFLWQDMKPLCFAQDVTMKSE